MFEPGGERRPLPEALVSEFNQLRLASLGAFTILQESDDVLHGDKVGDREVAEREFLQAAQLVSRAFLRHHSYGLGDEFLALNGLILETPLVKPEVLFRAISVGIKHATQEQFPAEKEILQPSVYVATVARNNTGKGIVGDFLRKEYGFVAYPLSDRVKELAAAYGNEAPFDRDTLIETGKQAKASFGAGVLIQAAVRMFSEPGRAQKLLFDGLRTQAEARDFLALGGGDTETVLIGVITGEEEEADQRLRFQRALKRGGPKDPTDDSAESFAQFCEQDDREGAGIDAAMELATHMVVNREGEQEVTLSQLGRIARDVGLSM